MTVAHSWGESVYTQLYSHGGRSVTRIPSTSEQVCMQQAGLCLQASLHPQPSRSLSLALPPLQPLLSCSRAAQSTGRSSLESIIAYFPHVCSEQADQGQVRILAGHRNFHFLYTPPLQDSRLSIYAPSIFCNSPCARKLEHCNQIPQ